MAFMLSPSLAVVLMSLVLLLPASQAMPSDSSEGQDVNFIEHLHAQWGIEWQPRHVHLAYGNISSEVVVTWSTLSEIVNATIEWGNQIFALNESCTGTSTLFTDGGELKAEQWIHRVKLTGLNPNTIFYYHVGGNSGWSAVFGFKTIPAGTEGWTLRLAFFGDMGVDNAHSLTRLQQEAHQGMYDLILHVGDFAYNLNTNNGVVGDTFMDQIEPIAAYVPYMTCPGNHESSYDFSNYRNRFTMPNYEETESMYYSFNLGPVHFIAINTELYYFGPFQMKRLNDQYNWLIDDLKASTTEEAREERPWIILFGHRPMYCSTLDEDDCRNVNARTRVGIHGNMFALEPLLAEYGVDMAIWGHEHTYERLWPLYNYTVLNGTDQPYTNPRGPLHIISGSAGCIETPDHFIPRQPEWSAFHSRDYGYTRLTVLNKTHLYLEEVSDDQDGKVVDTVMLIREHHENFTQYITDP